MSKITAYAALTSVASGDVLPIVDISDTSMAASGTTKKIAVSDLTALTTQLDSTSGDIQAPGTQAAGSSALAARADHVHPSPVAASAADVGVITWTGDPAYLNGAPNNNTSGKLHLSAFWVRKTATISSIAVAVSTAGSGLTSGQNLAGIYNSSGTLMGSTADRSTAWTSTGLDDIALTASFSASPGMYWAGLLSNGTTPAAFRGTANAISLIQLGQSAAASRAGIYSSGLTALPGTITPSSIVQTNAIIHCVILH